MTGTPVTFTRPASQWAIESLLLDDLSVVTLIDCNGKSWPLMGGMAPLMGGDDGVFAQTIKGLHAPLAHIDQQGAHQIGVDYLDTTYDKSEIDILISLQGRTIGRRRRVVREWIDGWAPESTCRLVWFTSQLGHWWVDLRPLKEPTDELTMGDALKVDMNWAARADFPFWKSFDSTSPKLTATSSTNLAAAPDPLTGYVSPPNFLPLWNRGTQKGWPRYIAQGPGTFTFGDNGSASGRTITISLAAGETVLIPTIPNRNRITDVASGAPVFKKLKGRFATPVNKGAAVRVPVTVTGATPGVTSVIGTLTPWRRWPE